MKIPACFMMVCLAFQVQAVSLLAEPPKKITPLVRCLGQEELDYHNRHDTGPNYKLNQKFINSMAGVNDMELVDGVYERICYKGAIPSVNLLKELLINGLDIFKLEKEDFRKNAQQLTVLGDLEEELPHLFFKYIASLQELAADPHCLAREVPEIAFFTEKVFYLEEDVPRNRLIMEKEKLKRLFKKLKGIKKIYASCAQKKSSQASRLTN